MNLAQCLCCESANLQLVIDLGEQVPANAFHDGTQPQKALPLRLMRCLSCTHLQLDHLANADALYREYKYATSISSPMQAHFDKLAKGISGRVLEIGCNDGYLLGKLVTKGCEVVGVDPALNFDTANVIHEFWSPELATTLGKFDYVVATNVIAHMHDPRTALEACRQVLKPNGEVIVEVHNAESVMVCGQFDTIYHEHVSYFTIKSMQTLANKVGLYIRYLDFLPVHGGSLRFHLADQPGVFRCYCDGDWVNDDGLFEEYPKRVRSIGARLKLYVDADTIGFGASAKLVTVIQTFGLQLRGVADETPEKLGKYVASTNIPVVGLEALGGCILNGCWNYPVSDRLKLLAPGSVLVNYFPDVSSVVL